MFPQLELSPTKNGKTPSRLHDNAVHARRRTRSRVILLALGYYDPALHEGVADWIREHGWDLDTGMIRPGNLPLPSKWDGVVALVNRPEMMDWIRQVDSPVVHTLTAPTPELREATAQFPSVDCDYESIGVAGARHLLTLGNPTFAFYKRTSGEAEIICRAFVREMQRAGQEPVVIDFLADHPDFIPGQLSQRHDRLAWLAKRLRSLALPTAIMAEDDRFAMDLMAVARKLRLRVPEDLAILGVDDQRPLLSASPIGISSVDTNMRRIGYVAAQRVAELVNGEPSSRQRVLVPARRVVARESTATYAGPHSGVSEALRFVRQNFRHPLSTEEVARHVNLTPRGLQRALKEEAHLTLNGEITRLRLEAAAQHLERSDLKLDAVASEVGLNDGKNLCRLFRQHYGATPSQWRDAGHRRD